MVGNPVEYHLHAETVSFLDDILELIDCAEFRIERSVILHGIITAKLTFSAILRNRVNGHEPEYVDSKLLQTLKLTFKLLHSAALGVLAQIDFINHCIAAPFGVLDIGKRAVTLCKRLLALLAFRA